MKAISDHMKFGNADEMADREEALTLQMKRHNVPSANMHFDRQSQEDNQHLVKDADKDLADNVDKDIQARSTTSQRAQQSTISPPPPGPGTSVREADTRDQHASASKPADGPKADGVTRSSSSSTVTHIGGERKAVTLPEREPGFLTTAESQFLLPDAPQWGLEVMVVRDIQRAHDTWLEKSFQTVGFLHEAEPRTGVE